MFAKGKRNQLIAVSNPLFFIEFIRTKKTGRQAVQRIREYIIEVAIERKMASSAVIHSLL